MYLGRLMVEIRADLIFLPVWNDSLTPWPGKTAMLKPAAFAAALFAVSITAELIASRRKVERDLPHMSWFPPPERESENEPKP